MVPFLTVYNISYLSYWNHLSKVFHTDRDIAVIVADLHLPTSEHDMQQQASDSHKNEEPKEILPQGKADELHQQARLASKKAGKDQNHGRSAVKDAEGTQKKARPPVKSRPHIAVEVFTVAVMTVLVEFFRQRHGK